MKKLSEVSKITGITRRALQGYDKMGLLSPTAKTDAGYWLYDDDAIRKLFVIKTFAEGGYTRERMREFFASPSADMLGECDALIGALEAERRGIDGKIRTIRLFKIESRLSDLARETLAKVDAADAYGTRSFAECFDALSARFAGLHGEVDALNLEAYLTLWYSLAVVGLLAGDAQATEQMDTAVDEAYVNFCRLMEALDGFSGDCEALEGEELRPQFPDFVCELLQDGQVAEALDGTCGKGSCDVIIRAVGQWGRAL